MQTRTLGRNGPTVSALGLGCMGMSEYYGTHDDSESIATLHHALERGVNFLDTALNPPAGLRVVRCTASATLDFSRTPLAWAIPWSPTIAGSGEAIPPPFRQ